MQLTSGLVGAGCEPEEMQISCDGLVRGRRRHHELEAHRARDARRRLTDEQLREIAERAKISCPVSQALAGIEITLDLPDLTLDDDEDDEEAAEDEEVGAAAEE